MPEIILQNVSKSLNGKPILQDIDLEIPNRSLYCILGPPKSGKSMLMRLIAGLEVPDRGKILFDGKDVTELSPVERKVAVVFQDFALYPHLTAFENIASPLTISGLTKDEIIKRVEKVAKYLKISHRLNHYPSELSGGELQRVAIARALVKEAMVLLLDEPFVRLDYKVREDMRAELYRLQKDIGINVILITSDPLDAMSLGDKIAIINEGKILQVGDRTEIYEKPADVFVARYFGVIEMNFLPGSVYKRGDEVLLKTKIFELRLQNVKKLLETGEVLIGLRPEHLSITEFGKFGGISLKGKLILSEVIGSDTILHLDVGLSEPLKVLVPEIYRKHEGTEIEVEFNPEALYFFSLKDNKLIARGGDIIG
ncbi:MAG: ABC transporter ATP-binding protein [Desulfurococcaceae archaeon]